jgi:hypothetical protein
MIGLYIYAKYNILMMFTIGDYQNSSKFFSGIGALFLVINKEEERRRNEQKESLFL